MNKQPFIIDIKDGELPNLSQDSENSYGFVYSKNDIWQEDSFETVKLLNSINEKLDMLISILEKNGRE